MKEPTTNQTSDPAAPRATAARPSNPPATSSAILPGIAENSPLLEADKGETSTDDAIMRFGQDVRSSVPSSGIAISYSYVYILAYIMPNDEMDKERLNVAHAIMVQAIKTGLTLLLLRKRKSMKVLMSALALEFGWSRWVIFQRMLRVPANVRFGVNDVESPWAHEKKHDYLFCRFMTASIADWPQLASGIYNNLSPGDWAELHEMDPEIYSDDGTYTETQATWS
ncbi:umta methyltransferase [Colletotrichum incanum]|uniref:Umta methyltransferase n=1 Tax=Colletotrichum incanum TaxID=1573173 RepID=A0A166M2Z6_COLIC|nr:umta methyltransferase [Colletotrichum incanum]